MAHTKEMLLPSLGDIGSVRVAHWIVSPGEIFSSGDTLLEVETDKAVVEVPASEDGKLVEQLVRVDELLEPNALIARIEVEGGQPKRQSKRATSTASPTHTTDSVPQAAIDPVTAQSHSSPAPFDSDRTGGSDRKLITPVARKLARENSLDPRTITGTGPQGRVVKADVVAALERRETLPHNSVASKRDGTASNYEEFYITTADGDIYTKKWTPVGALNSATIVLIHGAFGDSENWAGTVSDIVRKGSRVVAFDLPCHGRSRSNTACFEDIVKVSVEALDKVNLGPMALVGHSFGAGVATRIARHPMLEITSLTLLSPIGFGTEIEQSFLNGMINANSLAALKREMSKLTVARTTPSDTYLKELLSRLTGQADKLAMLTREMSSNGVQQLYIVQDIEALTCPVTIVHGRDDAIIPWSHVLNAPPKAALHVLPNVGHMPQWEAAALTGEIIMRSARER